MSAASQVAALATRVAQEFKSIRVALNTKSTSNEELFMSAALFQSQNGTPVRDKAGNGRWDSWLLARTGGTFQSIVGTISLPSDWTTYACDLIYANHGGQSGTWSGYVVTSPRGIGDDLQIGLTEHPVKTITPAAQHFLARVPAIVSSAPAGQFVSIRFARRVGDAADLNTGQMAFIGLVFRKLT